MESKESSCPPNAVSSTETDLKNSMEDVKKAIQNQDLKSALLIAKKCLEDINNIPLKIAITGESGTGKSTLVNAFRGIDNTDERAAETGVVETTMKPEPYPHPIHPNVTLWDLPGIGTSKFPADEYLKHVQFEKLDFFILVSADRFTQNDAMLAQNIKKMGKKLFFVRSKIDHNLRDVKKYDEEKTLQRIKENCIQGLEELGVASPQVFLVASFDLHLYDFPDLQETMERELPSHKRDVLTLALPNICKNTILKKKAVFRSQIWQYALLSAGVAALPIPGLSIAADVGILTKVLQDYLLGFGLDKKSVEKLSSVKGIPLHDLMAVLKFCCSGKTVTEDIVLFLLKCGTVVSWIPFVGSLIEAGISFTTISTFLSSTLDSLAVDAENIMMKALEN